MNRLQKKCLIATAGFHLLLVVILIVGPGFFTSKPKPDNTPLLDVIPANAIEAELSSGVKAAQPPAPTPIVPPPQPIVTPPQPQPTPPAPAPTPVTPAPSIVTRVEQFFKPDPITPAEDPTPKPEKAKPKPHEIKPNMETVKRTAVKNPPTQNTTDDSQQKEAQREARQRAKEIAQIARNIRDNSSSSTTVEMPGSSSVSYASYASIIKSIYTRAWTTPDNAANDEANTKVSVTVSSDGTVISAHIVGASGDASMDASVQRTLDRVTFIAPFPDGSTEKEKTFIINFNLKAKRMLG